jgi:hypothetical protein
VTTRHHIIPKLRICVELHLHKLLQFYCVVFRQKGYRMHSLLSVNNEARNAYENCAYFVMKCMLLCSYLY